MLAVQAAFVDGACCYFAQAIGLSLSGNLVPVLVLVVVRMNAVSLLEADLLLAAGAASCYAELMPFRAQMRSYVGIADLGAAVAEAVNAVVDVATAIVAGAALIAYLQPRQNSAFVSK